MMQNCCWTRLECKYTKRRFTLIGTVYDWISISRLLIHFCVTTMAWGHLRELSRYSDLEFQTFQQQPKEIKLCFSQQSDTKPVFSLSKFSIRQKAVKLKKATSKREIKGNFKSTVNDNKKRSLSLIESVKIQFKNRFPSFRRARNKTFSLEHFEVSFVSWPSNCSRLPSECFNICGAMIKAK